MFSRKDTVEKGVTDSCSPVHNIQGRLEIMAILLELCQNSRVLIRDPARVHGIHENPVLGQIRGCGVGEHVQSSLGHIGVGMATALFKPQKFAFHGRNIDHMFLTGIVFLH